MPSRSRVAVALSRLLHEEDGPTATEYAVLLALIILVAAAAIQGIGERMQAIYDNINCSVPTE